MFQVKPYKKSSEYSFTLGAFPTVEMLKCKPECVDAVYFHSSFTDKEYITSLCETSGIPAEVNDKLINRLSDKENVYVIGVFRKYKSELDAAKPHIVLVNPSNMGNLGTIIRTAAGFDYENIAVINPGVDMFNPKVVRSSMGAVFRVSTVYFDSFTDYQKIFKSHEMFTFMLNAEHQLTLEERQNDKVFSLIFGNEATGLDDSFLNIGKSIIIPQSDKVDSLNLTIAAGIAMYAFSQVR